MATKKPVFMRLPEFRNYLIIEVERGFYFAMDKCRERKYFCFRRQFSYVTGKNTDKYKAEVNES